MSQLYLCDEPYWSKYDHSEICPHSLQINVISDGKTDNSGESLQSVEEYGIGDHSGSRIILLIRLIGSLV